MPDALQSVLDPAPIPKSVKADLWDAYHASGSTPELQVKLNAMKDVPNSVKSDMWELKNREYTARIASRNAMPTQFEQQAANQPGILGTIGQAATTGIPPEVLAKGLPMLNPEPGRQLKEAGISAGSPLTAGLGAFEEGVSGTAGKIASGATSPAAIGSMLLGGIPAAATAAGFGAAGFKPALQPIQPGESPADYLERSLLGFAQVSGGAAGTGAGIKGRIGEALAKRMGVGPGMAEEAAGQVKTGARTIADTAQAVVQEKAAVSKPFQEIGEAIKKPVSSPADIRDIINSAAADAGIQPSEIPRSVYAAIPEETTSARAASAREAQTATIAKNLLDGGMALKDVRSAIQNLGFVPAQVRTIMAMAAPEASGAIGFNDITRIREDVYGAAQSAKDGAVRNALMQAHDALGKMQERAAEDAGMGAKYKAAKQAYMQHMRTLGSPIVSKTLEASDFQDQALEPKVRALTTGSNASTLWMILKQAGIDTKPLEGMRDIVPGKAPQELKGMSDEQVARERLQGIANNMKAQGISNPYGFILTAYGLMEMATGRPFGLLMAGRGGAMLKGPELIQSPQFQDFVLKSSGVTPGSRGAVIVRKALTALAPALQSRPRKEQQ